MANKFSVKDWSEEFELTDETISVLAKKGFNSFKTISRITQEILGKEFSKALNTGQYIMLCDAVQSLKPVEVKEQGADNVTPIAHGSVENGRNEASGSSGNQQELTEIQQNTMQILQEKLNVAGSLTVSDIMDIVHGSRTTAQAPENLSKEGTATGNGPSLFDPLDTKSIKTGSSNNIKFRDIRDHISSIRKNSHLNQDPCGTLKVGAVEVALSPKESKISLEKVQLTQYMEASLKILKAMVVEDGADLARIMEYVNYLIKFATFAQSFSWQALLRYDFEYRKEQAEMGFAWGSDSPYLMQLHLFANRSVGQHGDQGKVRMGPRHHALSSHNKYDPLSGKPICRKFNQSSGCDLLGCKFVHICMSCYGKHSDCLASRNNSKPNAQ